jgi:hypothetical protein
MKNPPTGSKYLPLNSRLRGSAIGTALTTCQLVPLICSTCPSGAALAATEELRQPSVVRVNLDVTIDM